MDIIATTCWLGALISVVAASIAALGRAHGRIARLEARMDRKSDCMFARMETMERQQRSAARRISEAKEQARAAAGAAGTALVEARADVAALREHADARMDAMQAQLEAVEDESGIRAEE